jgi:two-component system, NarL family, response regulator DevR
VIRVLLVDDHEIVRRGLADLFEADGDIEVTGHAGSLAEAKRIIDTADPHVAVLDVRLPDGTGMDLCAEFSVSHPDVACMMLTSFADDRAVVEAAEAGAAAYLLKEVASNDIVQTLRKVAAGGRLLDAATVRMATGRLNDSEEGRLEVLSGQEKRIFDLIGAGYSNRQIADELYLAEKTVKNYVSNMLAKLGMDRRTEAAALAARIEERKRSRFS